MLLTKLTCRGIEVRHLIAKTCLHFHDGQSGIVLHLNIYHTWTFCAWKTETKHVQHEHADDLSWGSGPELSCVCTYVWVRIFRSTLPNYYQLHRKIDCREVWQSFGSISSLYLNYRSLNPTGDAVHAPSFIASVSVSRSVFTLVAVP